MVLSSLPLNSNLHRLFRAVVVFSPLLFICSFVSFLVQVTLTAAPDPPFLDTVTLRLSGHESFGDAAAPLVAQEFFRDTFRPVTRGTCFFLSPVVYWPFCFFIFIVVAFFFFRMGAGSWLILRLLLMLLLSLSLLLWLLLLFLSLLLLGV
jgi:hypothetical protein